MAQNVNAREPSECEHFVSELDGTSSSQLEFFDNMNSKRRVRLLSQPLTGWALNFLSEKRMEAASKKNGKELLAAFARAELLVRSWEDIQAEMQTQKQQGAKDKLDEKNPFVGKRKKITQAANQFFQQYTGENPTNPSEAGLQKILGADPVFIQTLGPDVTREVLAAFLSSRDPNILLPSIKVIIRTLEELKIPVETYEKWQGHADRHAIGERLHWYSLRRTPNHAEVAKANAHMKKLRDESPSVAFRDPFYEAQSLALGTYDITLDPRKASAENFKQAWESVAAGDRDLAQYTARALLATKVTQSKTPLMTREEHRVEKPIDDAPPAPSTPIPDEIWVGIQQKKNDGTLRPVDRG